MGSLMGSLAYTLDQALAAARETRFLMIGAGILPSETSGLFMRAFPGWKAIVVADPRTFAVAGQVVDKVLRAGGVMVLPPALLRDAELYAESRFVAEVEAALKDNDAIPVAVGSGTINDLVKLAAHRHGRSYLCVATAASMDGYTAFGASITHEGSKQTFDCPAPLAVLADLEVISAAPAEMRGWGYADLFAKVTAGADWILADALGVEKIDEQAWGIVQGRLHEVLSDPGDMAGLVEGLMLGGFAMQATRSSRPASGAEHQFSHLWDMQHHTHEGSAPSHGAKVGIATLAITRLYEALLEMNVQGVDVEPCVREWPSLAQWQAEAEAHFTDAELRTVALREITAKHDSAEELRAQVERLKQVWPELRLRLKAQLVPSVVLKQRLQAAGAVVEPEQIGISRERLRSTFKSAFFIRRRFTVLDLVVRTGLLDAALDKIFSA
jgi:glycerol-1-phosphate dehydrogenase [NAD(P)+]